MNMVLHRRYICMNDITDHSDRPYITHTQGIMVFFLFHATYALQAGFAGSSHTIPFSSFNEWRPLTTCCRVVHQSLRQLAILKKFFTQF